MRELRRLLGYLGPYRRGSADRGGDDHPRDCI